MADHKPACPSCGGDLRPHCKNSCGLWTCMSRCKRYGRPLLTKVGRRLAGDIVDRDGNQWIWKPWGSQT